jgi:hypothetical protein
MGMAVNFQQSLDIDRPHSLLTEDTKRSASLRYRYDDTHEEVLVPNIWYNQTYKDRVGYFRFLAQTKEDSAAKFAKYAPVGMSSEEVVRMVSKLKEQAEKIRSEAKRMEDSGEDTHPVAASHIVLNFDILDQ